MIQGPKCIDYSTAYALSGVEGIQLAKDMKPDLVIVDAMLPDTKGVDVCRGIKSDPALSQCLVLLLESTAAPTTADYLESVETCTDSYIARPVSNEELSAHIQTMLRIKSIQHDFQAGMDRFRQVFETVRLPFLILDESGSIISVNPAWEKRIGYNKTDVIGTSIYDMLSDSDANNLRFYLSYKETSESIPDVELNVCCKDGSMIRILFNSFRETDIDGGHPSIFCTMYDLPHKSTSPDNFLKAQQLEFTATLAGGIAHDFNNLLMSIMGNISLAQLLINPEDKAVKMLQRAEAMCNEGKALTQQFIILSKCGYPSKKPSSILKLLKDSSVIEKTNPKIDVILDLPDDIWKIEVDEYQIKYVLSHLMTNAAESMPDGGKVHISIRNIISSEKPPLPAHPIASGCFLNIGITDHGKGISSEHLPRIFDPYYTTKEMGPRKGLGLGLTTVYSIIHKHDGFIFIESEVNQGTTVNIYLPALPE